MFEWVRDCEMQGAGVEFCTAYVLSDVRFARIKMYPKDPMERYGLVAAGDRLGGS